MTSMIRHFLLAIASTTVIFDLKNSMDNISLYSIISLKKIFINKKKDNKNAPKMYCLAGELGPNSHVLSWLCYIPSCVWERRGCRARLGINRNGVALCHMSCKSALTTIEKERCTCFGFVHTLIIIMSWQDCHINRWLCFWKTCCNVGRCGILSAWNKRVERLLHNKLMILLANLYIHKVKYSNKKNN